MCCVFHVPETSDRGDIETASKQGRKALYLDYAACRIYCTHNIYTYIRSFWVWLVLFVFVMEISGIVVYLLYILYN